MNWRYKPCPAPSQAWGVRMKWGEGQVRFGAGCSSKRRREKPSSGAYTMPRGSGGADRWLGGLEQSRGKLGPGSAQAKT